MHQWPPIAKSAFWSKRPSRLSKSQDPLRRKSCTGTRRASHAYGAMSGHILRKFFMKRIVGAVMVTAALTAPGLAADLGARSYTKAAPAVASVSNWSGFYIGGNLGYGWATEIRTARSCHRLRSLVCEIASRDMAWRTRSPSSAPWWRPAHVFALATRSAGSCCGSILSRWRRKFLSTA